MSRRVFVAPWVPSARVQLRPFTSSTEVAVAPAGPAGPGGPTAPSSPSAPGAPSWPSRPGGAVLTVVPGRPIRSGRAVEAVGTGSAGAPSAPARPSAPAGPRAPSAPAGPGAPSGPAAPLAPAAPLRTGGAAGTGRPTSSVGPLLVPRDQRLVLPALPPRLGIDHAQQTRALRVAAADLAGAGARDRRPRDPAGDGRRQRRSGQRSGHRADVGRFASDTSALLRAVPPSRALGGSDGSPTLSRPETPVKGAVIRRAERRPDPRR